jgi:hypothetical protein
MYNIFLFLTGAMVFVGIVSLFMFPNLWFWGRTCAKRETQKKIACLISKTVL